MLSSIDKANYKRDILGFKTVYIPGADFIGSRGLDYKEAIQELYCEVFFPSLTPNDLLNTADERSLNVLIDVMKSRHRQYFDFVFNYKPNGIGPGEVMLYFLTNNSKLAGFKTGDLVINDTTYEVKVPKIVSRNGKMVANDVRLASIKNLDNVYYKLLTLQRKYNLRTLEKSQLDILRQKDPSMANIESDFQKGVEEYFSNKYAIFLYGGDAGGKRGSVAAVKKVKANEVSLLRVTAREFKADIEL